MLTASRPGRDALMNADERAQLQRLPDTVRIYRGFSRPDGQTGMSWTTDEPRARWFARRLTRDGDEPRLAVGDVDRCRIIAYFARRGEREVLALPEHVRVIAVRDA